MAEAKVKEDTVAHSVENQIACGKITAEVQEKEDVAAQLEESTKAKAQQQQVAEAKKANANTTFVPTISLPCSPSSTTRLTRILSPCNQPLKRNSTSPISLVVTQGHHQKTKISSPPFIQKLNLESTFYKAFVKLVDASEDLGHFNPIATGAYTGNDLHSDRDTGQLIVKNILCVTESIGIDFRNKATRYSWVILQKVKDKNLLCKITPDDHNAACFLHIIADFKASNFGTILYLKDSHFQRISSFLMSSHFSDALQLLALVNQIYQRITCFNNLGT